MHPEIIKLRITDVARFSELIQVFKLVFEMENFSIPDIDYLSNLLNDKKFLVYVAIVNGKTVGGLTAYILHQYYDQKPLAYIYDLAVTTDYQRQGIGRQLIATIRSDCHKSGFNGMFVQADLEDEHALEFYRATGGKEQQVLHFNYS